MDIFVTDMTVNQRVVGSSPTGGAIIIKELYTVYLLFYFVFRHDFATTRLYSIRGELERSNSLVGAFKEQNIKSKEQALKCSWHI